MWKLEAIVQERREEEEKSQPLKRVDHISAVNNAVSSFIVPGKECTLAVSVIGLASSIWLYHFFHLPHTK